MLSPRLTDCVDCTTISALLSNIDCKLTELANREYNNIVFSLNYPINGVAIGDLLNYKRILTYKLCNEDYAAPFTVQMIASRVKLLTVGANNCCPTSKPRPITTTTSSTTAGPTTTTTSSTSTTTSSTTSVPQELLDISLSYSSANCATACGTEPTFYYAYTTCRFNIIIGNAPQILGCVLYTDASGTTTVPDGFYSTQTGVCVIVSGGSGVITGVTSCP